MVLAWEEVHAKIMFEMMHDVKCICMPEMAHLELKKIGSSEN